MQRGLQERTSPAEDTGGAKALERGEMLVSARKLVTEPLFFPFRFSLSLSSSFIISIFLVLPLTFILFFLLLPFLHTLSHTHKHSLR